MAQIVGTTAGGMMRPASMSKSAMGVQRPVRLCRTNPTRAARTTMTATLATVMIMLLMKAVSRM